MCSRSEHSVLQVSKLRLRGLGLLALGHVFSDLSVHGNPRRGLVETACGPPPTVSDSVGLGGSWACAFLTSSPVMPMMLPRGHTALDYSVNEDLTSGGMLFTTSTLPLYHVNTALSV